MLTILAVLGASFVIPTALATIQLVRERRRDASQLLVSARSRDVVVEERNGVVRFVFEGNVRVVAEPSGPFAWLFRASDVRIGEHLSLLMRRRKSDDGGNAAMLGLKKLGGAAYRFSSDDDALARRVVDGADDALTTLFHIRHVVEAELTPQRSLDVRVEVAVMTPELMREIFGAARDVADAVNRASAGAKPSLVPADLPSLGAASGAPISISADVTKK